MFNAILLAPVHGTDSYIRPGVVQIDLKTTENPQSMINILLAYIKSSHAVSASSQSSDDRVEWNMNAMYFIRHCYEQPESAYTIHVSCKGLNTYIIDR
jgi:hypothetical protein